MNRSPVLQHVDPAVDSFKVEFPNKENHHETSVENLFRHFTPHRADVNRNVGRHRKPAAYLHTWFTEVLTLVGC